MQAEEFDTHKYALEIESEIIEGAEAKGIGSQSQATLSGHSRSILDFP